MCKIGPNIVLLLAINLLSCHPRHLDEHQQKVDNCVNCVKNHHAAILAHAKKLCREIKQGNHSIDRVPTKGWVVNAPLPKELTASLSGDAPDYSPLFLKVDSKNDPSTVYYSYNSRWGIAVGTNGCFQNIEGKDIVYRDGDVIVFWKKER